MVTQKSKKIKRSLVFFIGLTLGVFITYAYALPSQANSVMVNDRNYFPTVIEEIQNSDSSIHVIIFEVKYYPQFPDSDEMKLLYELVNAKKRGVDVKIITDQFYTDPNALQYLRGNGIDIKYDSSSKTTHSKLLIIDGKKVIVGSTNWSYYSINLNHESNALIHSKELASSFEEYFKDVWNEQ